jgi:hypothetical protein
MRLQSAGYIGKIGETRNAYRMLKGRLFRRMGRRRE